MSCGLFMRCMANVATISGSQDCMAPVALYCERKLPKHMPYLESVWFPLKKDAYRAYSIRGMPCRPASMWARG